MTLIDYMAAGGEVVTDKIAAYVDKDVFNKLLKMSYGSLELIPAPDMVTTYTDTVLAINKYKYDTLLASATAELQSGAKTTTSQTHSGDDTVSIDSTNTLNQSGTTSDTTTNNTSNTSTAKTSGKNSTEYGHVIDTTTSGTDKKADTSTQSVANSGTQKTADTSTQTVKNTGTQTNAGTGATTNSVAAFDSDTYSARDKQDNTTSGTRTDDLTATTTNGGEVNVTTSGTTTTTNGGEVNVTTSGTAKDTHSGTDKLTSTGESTTTDSGESTTTASGESTTNATNSTAGTNKTTYGHIIITEQTAEYNSPEYIAAMRSAAVFSLAKIIAVDITAAICIGVW